MRTISHHIITFLIISILFLGSCGNDNQINKIEIQDTLKEKINESLVLRKFLENSGNFINQKKIPTMITVDEVFNNLNRYHIVDIRKHNEYVKGHIDGAVNVSREDLLQYMKYEISASSYEKIVIVCYTNQLASYATMMFRLLGFGNVYSMKYGMSSCDKTTAEKKWWKNISSKYSSDLETKQNPKNKKSKYPKIKTGQVTGYEILEARIKLLLKKQKLTVKADDVFENPDKYYIINYWPEEYYLKGHIPGAVQYTPKKSLIPQTKLSTLPTNKPIVVYCYTGQHAAFVTAYLQILGYDAYSLSYAANGFMYNKLLSEGIGHAYDKTKHYKSFPLVKGELPSLKKKVSSDNNLNETEDNSAPVVPVIKKKVEDEEEGGC